MPDDELALLGGDARLLDQSPPALVPVAVAVEAALALVPILRSGRRVRLVVLGERHAAVVLALLRAPAAPAGAAPARILAGRFRLSAAVAAPLGRSWLRGRAGASSRFLAVLRTANSGFRGRSETRGGAVQLLADELDDDAADELGDGPAQLVSDERLERLRRRGHGLESTTVLCPSRPPTCSANSAL
jgi:hypothetical protein